MGLEDRVIEDMIFIGCRKAKPMSAAELVRQIYNWQQIVSLRGYPYKFESLEHFERFASTLLNEVGGANLPVDDVRSQGSSVRKPSAGDIDVVIFVSQEELDAMLVDYFLNGKARKNGQPVRMGPEVSHANLQALAREITEFPGQYNSVAKQLARAINRYKFNSKTQINKKLKNARRELSSQFPELNLNTLSVQVRGGVRSRAKFSGEAGQISGG